MALKVLSYVSPFPLPKFQHWIYRCYASTRENLSIQLTHSTGNDSVNSLIITSRIGSWPGLIISCIDDLCRYANKQVHYGLIQFSSKAYLGWYLTCTTMFNRHASFILGDEVSVVKYGVSCGYLSCWFFLIDGRSFLVITMFLARGLGCSFY